jgi:hypothetical protein
MADPSAWRDNVSPDDPSASPYSARGGAGPDASYAGSGGGAEESLSNLYAELYGPGRPSGPPVSPPEDQYGSGGYAGDAYAAEPPMASYEAPLDEPPPARGGRRGGGYEPPDDGWGYESRRRRNTSRWLNGTTAAIAGGLALVIAVTGILLYTRGSNPAAAQGRTPDREIPAPAPDASGNAGDRKKLPTSPVLGAIKDRAAGLSYARLGGKWSLARNAWMRDHGWPIGQDAVAMRNFEGSNDYLSGCYSGLLSRDIRYNSSADLKAATELLADSVEKANDVYPARHERRDLESKPLTVGDRQAWLVRMELRFPQARKERWDFNRETAAFIVVDRGASQRPGMLFMTLPNSHKAQGDINLVLNSLRAA